MSGQIKSGIGLTAVDTFLGRVGSGIGLTSADTFRVNSGGSGFSGLVRFCTSIPGSSRVRVRSSLGRIEFGLDWLSPKHGSGRVRVSLTFPETRVGFNSVWLSLKLGSGKFFRSGQSLPPKYTHQSISHLVRNICFYFTLEEEGLNEWKTIGRGYFEKNIFFITHNRGYGQIKNRNECQRVN